MTGFANPAWVEQAVFGNQDGMRIVASSVADHAAWGRWEAALDGFQRIESVPGVAVPQSALSYFVLSEHEVAVLYRWRDEESSSGRNPSRMLVGSPNVLSVQDALGLYQWPQWTRYVAGQQLQSLPAGDVLQAAQLGFGRLNAQALHLGSTSLERMLAPLIDSQGRKLSVLGCPQESCAAAMLALHEMGERYLWNRFEKRWYGSFSTYEIEHAGRMMPDVVFLPARPSGPDPVSRSVVDLQAPTNASPDAVAQARMLVQRFLSGDRSELEIVSTPRPSSLDDDRAIYPPADARSLAQGRDASDLIAQNAALSGAQSGRVLDSYSTRHDVSADPRPSAQPERVRAGSAPSSHTRPRAEGGSGNGWPSAANGADSDPIGGILNSGDGKTLQQRLLEMARSADSTSRIQLRKAVHPERIDELVQAINYLVVDSPKARAECHEQLIDLLFGPESEDLPQGPAIEYATMIVGESFHDRFVDRLVRRAARFPACYAALATPLAQRYLVTHGLPRPSRANTQSSARPHAKQRWIQVGWRQLTIAGVAALTLLYLGYLIGGFGATSAPADPTAQPSQTQKEPTEAPANTSEAAPTLPPITVPAALVAEGQKVYVMVENTDGKLQFGSPCEPSGETEWNCPGGSYPVGARAQGRRPILVIVAPDAAVSSIAGNKLVRDDLTDLKVTTLIAVGS